MTTTEAEEKAFEVYANVDEMFHSHDFLFPEPRKYSESEDGSVRVSFEIITPEIAEYYLQRNTKNRALGKVTAQTYAKDMIKDRWFLNTDAIGFDSAGALMNGQHRLTAIMNSGKAVEMMVVYGLDEDARATIDIQRKRTVGDELRMRGFGNYSHLGSAVKMRMFYENKSLGQTHDYRPTNQEMIEKADMWNDSMQHAIQAGSKVQRRLRLSTTAYAVAYSLFVEKDPELADEYFDKLATGANLEGTSLAVNSRLENMAFNNTRGAQLPSYFVLWVLIRGWNALRTGEVLHKIQIPNQITGAKMLKVI